MPKSKHIKKMPKRKPKPDKPIKQRAKKATLNDTAQDIIDLYGEFLMTSEYDNIPDTVDIIRTEKAIEELINRIQSVGVEYEEIAATLYDYLLCMQDAYEQRGFVIGYQYAKKYANNNIHDEKGEEHDDE